MTASPAVLAAFETWKRAQLASHYAAPCPDEVMDHLVDVEGNAFAALQDLPAANADDMLLKLFPIVLREFETPAGQPPMKLGPPRVYIYEPEFLEHLAAQFGGVCPAVAEAMASPHRLSREIAA